MKKILEVGKSYVAKEYGGDLKKAVAASDGILWDSIEKIHNGLDFSSPDKSEQRTSAVLKKHIEMNRAYAYFVEV